MINLLLRLLLTVVALKGADILIPGFNFHGGFLTLCWFSIVLGLLNWILKPILVFFSFPLLILTIGIFYFVLNALLLYVTSLILPGVLTGTIWGFLMGGFLVTVFQWLLTVLFRVRKHD